jgi:dihydropteroate synthase
VTESNPWLNVDQALARWPLAMNHDIKFVGIINTSPDSYVSGSVAATVDAAVALAGQHVREGAHLVEIGGQSGGSLAGRVSAEQEIRRTADIVRAVCTEYPQIDVVIDTFRSQVAAAAVDAGATWINDITAMEHDPRIVDVAKDAAATVVIVHMAGRAGRRLKRAVYTDVVAEVKEYLRGRIDELGKAGIPRERIVIDSGPSLGKQPAHDFALLAGLRTLQELGCRQMAPVSRRQFIEAVDPVGPELRLGGSIAAALWAAVSGCSYLRVHEIRPYAQAIDVWNAILSNWAPAGQQA